MEKQNSDLTRYRLSDHEPRNYACSSSGSSSYACSSSGGSDYGSSLSDARSFLGRSSPSSRLSHAPPKPVRRIITQAEKDALDKEEAVYRAQMLEKRAEGLGTLNLLCDDTLLEILSFLTKPSDLNSFGSASWTCLHFSRDRSLLRPLMAKLMPRMWGALNADQKRCALANRGERSSLIDPYEYVGPLCYNGREVSDLGVDDTTLVHSEWFYCGEEYGVRVWKHQTDAAPYAFFGHTDHVYCCALGDGVVITGSADRTLKVWESTSGTCLRTLEGHSDIVVNCLLASDRIVSVSYDSTVRIWDLRSGAPIAVIDVSTINADVAIVGDTLFCQLDHSSNYGGFSLETGERLFEFNLRSKRDFAALQDALVVATRFNGIQRFNASTGLEAVPLKMVGDQEETCCETEGDIIVSGTNQGTLRVWDHKTSRLQRSWQAGQGSLKGCPVSQGVIYSFGKDSTALKVWDLATGTLLQSMDLGLQIKRCYALGTSIIVKTEAHEVDVRSIEGANVFVWSRVSEEHPHLEVHPTAEERVQEKEQEEARNAIRAVAAFEQEQLRLRHERLGDLAGLTDGLIISCLSYLDTLEDVHSFGMASRSSLKLSRRADFWKRKMAHELPQVWETLSEDERKEAWAQHRFHQMPSDPLEYAGPIHYKPHQIRCMAVDDELLVNGAYENAVQAWNHRAGEKLPTLFGHADWIRACAIGDGIIASGGGDRCLKIWNRANGQLIRTFRGHGDSIRKCIIAGNRIVSASRESVRIWDRDSDVDAPAKIVPSTFGRKVKVVGDLLLVQEGHSDFAFLDLQSGEKRFDLSINGFKQCAYSEGHLFIATRFHGIRRVDAATGEEVPALKEYDEEVMSCSVDGNTVVGGSDDGVIRVWNNSSGELIHSWQSGQGKIKSCQLKSGVLYVLGEAATEVRTWDPVSGRPYQSFGNGSQIRRCHVLGTTVILHAKDERDAGPNVFVWARRSEEHPPLLEVDGPYAETAPELEPPPQQPQPQPVPYYRPERSICQRIVALIPDGPVTVLAGAVGVAASIVWMMRRAPH